MVPLPFGPETGIANSACPEAGVKGSGTIYAESHKRAGVWQLEMLVFVNKRSSERLDLLVAGVASKPTT